MSTGDDNEQTGSQRRGYRYRPADAPESDARDETPTGALAEDEDAIDDADLDEEFADDDDADLDEPPSEFWPAAELLKGATIANAELELSYSASIYVNTPVAELRLWLQLPDGTVRLAQIDEPQSVWLYRQAHGASGRDFEGPRSPLRVAEQRSAGPARAPSPPADRPADGAPRRIGRARRGVRRARARHQRGRHDHRRLARHALAVGEGRATKYEVRNPSREEPEA